MAELRALFITGEFPPMQGGVGDCTNEIAKELAARGAQIRVLTSTKAADATRNLQPWHQPPGRVSAISPLIEQWNWSSLRVIKNVTREFEPDVVHIQYQTGAFGMHPAIDFLPRYFRFRSGDVGRAPRRGLAYPRVVTTFHDLRVPYLFPKAGPVRGWVTRELARSSDAVVVTNAEDYDAIIPHSTHCALIPIGSNVPTVLPADFDRAAWRMRYGVTENETLLCYFGFLNESKGGETLIRALAQSPKAKLTMIGGQVGASDPTNAAYLEKVRALISKLGLTDRVSWTNYTSPEIVTANFLASDICVLPYRDGASYRRGTLMAALAHGMPIVTTAPRDVGAIHESPLPRLRDGENCLLVPPDDPTALALTILHAMASPELRAKIGAGARELAQHFTWDKIVQQHLELYRQMTNRE